MGGLNVMSHVARVLAILLPLVVAGALAGCEPGPITIPPGAQVVHVIVTGDAVAVEPTAVRAGDIYMVLDEPGTNVVLVERMTAPEETPGPLSDDDLDRVAHGDSYHTAMTSGFANGEPHGNVTRLVLAPGRYVFLADDPECVAARAGGVIPPGSMAVLQVVP